MQLPVLGWPITYLTVKKYSRDVNFFQVNCPQEKS